MARARPLVTLDLVARAGLHLPITRYLDIDLETYPQIESNQIKDITQSS